MSIFKKLFLSFLLASSLVASDFSASGKLSFWYASYDKQIQTGETKEQNLYITNLQINTDYKKDNFYFQSTIFGYIYETQENKQMSNTNYYKPFDKSDIFFRSLYMSYNINQNLTIGAGVLPFSNSAPIKYTDDYIQDGEGINILNNNTLTSIFIKYEIGNSRTIVGIGTIDDILVNTGNYVDEVLEEDSYTVFIINTYNYNKFELISEALYTDMSYEGIAISEIYLLGFNFAWDDSEDSGLSLYGSVGLSLYDNHNTEAKNRIFTNALKENAPYGDYIMSKNPDSFAIENKKYYGGSHLFGARKDFSISTQEFFVNAEWFHTYGDWSSGNQGNIYFPKNNQMYSIRDDSYYINTGWVINDNTQLRLVYSYLEFKETGKIGGLMSTVPTKDYISEAFTKVEIIRVIFTYKF